MIDLNEDVKKLLLDNSIHRSLIIHFPEDDIEDITNQNIISDSLELKQSICEEKEFVMGGCIASQLTVQVIGINAALNNKRIEVYLSQTYGKSELVPDDSLVPSDDLSPGMQTDSITVQIFTGTIDSSLRQKNRAVKEIIAYDDFLKAANTSCFEYFKGLAAHSPTMNLATLRESLCESFLYGGYDYEGDFVGFNDENTMSLNLDLVKSVCNKKLSIIDLLTAYCELNACFAFIDGEGKIKFKQLINPETEYIDFYAELDFEEYVTVPINLIIFQYNKDVDFKYGYGTGGKQSWYISENVITKCCTDVTSLITNFSTDGANYIFNDLYSYRPFSTDIFGRWWIEPGDKVVIKTGFDDTETVQSFVFCKTIKGINGLRVSLKAQGPEYLGKDEINNEL
ncbi:MAG: hypothetical protein U0L20_01545 [Ruminococcus sp.]|nr:hypothetical protein [Ruminococcus sp.]